MTLKSILKESALLIVDVQNDFCPGGALAVKEGDAVVPVINRISRSFARVAATQDWHPEGHISFASRHGRDLYEVLNLDGKPQILWPDHCIQGTPGANFHPGLDLRPIDLILRKGSNPDLDSYSGFLENDRETHTGLDGWLKGLGIRRLFICGLATDYCVYFTAEDSRALGYETWVVLDACRGVNVPEGSVEKTQWEMRNLDIRMVGCKEICE